MPIPSATMQVCSPKCTPSSISAASCSSDRSADIMSERARSVAATNRREIDGLEVPVGLLDAAADRLQAEWVAAGG